MKSKSQDILVELLGDMQAKFNAYQSAVNKNNSNISEMKYYMQSIMGEDDSNLKMFSPRNVESINKEEFDKINMMVNTIQAQNEKYQRKMMEVQSEINKLEEILKIENTTETNLEEEIETDINFKGSKMLVLTVQEKERQQLIKEFEVTTLQNLTYIIQEVDSCMMFIDHNPLHAKMKLSSINRSIINIIKDVGNTLNNFGTLVVSDGLKLALEKLIIRLNERNEYTIEKDIDDVSCENNYRLITIYRIIQECLVNIAKHAEADKIVIKCKLKDNIYYIDIEDNGKGITSQDLQNKNFGISLMKERVELLDGTMKIQSKKNIGTNFHIEIPITYK